MAVSTRRTALLALLGAGLAARGARAGASPDADPGAGTGAPTPSALAIRGYDPVAYFTWQHATPGDPAITWEWDEHVWQFANARHRALFQADPVRYAPQFSNFCAVALARGELLPANPEYWLISDGRLYLFGKPQGPASFRRALESNIERANRHRGLLPAQPRE